MTRSVAAWPALVADLLATGRFTEAMEAARREVDRDRARADPWWCLAVAAERAGAFGRAREACDEALRRRPGHVGAWMTLGHLEAGEGARVAAIEAFRRGSLEAPDDAVMAHLLRSVGGGDFSSPLRAEVTELFDGYAERFDAHLVDSLGYHGHEALAAALASWLERAPAGADRAVAWDLGCGTGLCGAGIRPRVGRLVGVDLSRRMLEAAEARGLYDALFAADLVYALATIPSASTDVLFAADALGYVGDLAGAFEEARRALRPGGAWAFTVEARAGRGFAMTASRRCAYAEGYLRGCAEAAGMAIQRLDRAPLRWEDGAPVSAWLAIFTRGDG